MIRPAAPKDAAAIAGLWNDVIAHSLATFTTEPKTPDHLQALILLRAGCFWVLDEDGDVQGFMTYGPFRAGPGYLATAEHTIILAPNARGRGAGTTLLGHGLKQAGRAGIHAMIAGISGANPAAVRFHSNAGFHRVGQLPEVGQKNGQKLDLILMQKFLSDGHDIPQPPA